jgi:hypothetical protein
MLKCQERRNLEYYIHESTSATSTEGEDSFGLMQRERQYHGTGFDYLERILMTFPASIQTL